MDGQICQILEELAYDQHPDIQVDSLKISSPELEPDIPECLRVLIMEDRAGVIGLRGTNNQYINWESAGEQNQLCQAFCG